MFAQMNQTVARAALGATGAALCAAVCLFGAAAPVDAATVDTLASTATVSYADLDVSRAEGRATLASRLHRAARSVCSAGDRSVRELAMQKACVRNNVEVGMQTAISRTQVAVR